METRGSEYRSNVLAGESYSASEEARYVAQVKQTAAWIPGPVAPGVALPLSMSELLNLYRSNTAITARDERELALFLPEPGKLVSPLEFEQLIIEQAQLLQKNLSYRRDL